MKVSFDFLCLDERDSANLSELRGKTRNEIKQITNRRYFGLCGIIIPGATYPKVKIEGRKIQQKCFGSGIFKPFHYTEILNNSGNFASLGKDSPKRTSLIALLNNYLLGINFKILASFIDKQELALEYGVFENRKLTKIGRIRPGISSIDTVKKVNLYLIALKFMLKDYYEYLKIKKGSGIIIAEARGEKEDLALLDAFYFYQKSGISTVSATELRNYVVDILIIHKKQNHLGIQVADLVTYPVYDYFVPEHNTRRDHFIRKSTIEKKVKKINIFPKPTKKRLSPLFANETLRS